MAKMGTPTFQSGGGYITLLREALAAKDGATLGRAKGDSCLLATLRTYCARFNASEMMRIAHGLRAGENGHALGLAVLAALRFILEILVAEKDLFPSGENEVGPAVDAG
jgi:hypothetical protein